MTATTIIPSTNTCTNRRVTTWTLVGSTNENSLDERVKRYSDGYKIVSSMTMEATPVNTMVGTCVLYYYDSNSWDDTNGAVCHAVVSDATTATSIAASGQYAFVVPKQFWVSAGVAGVTRTNMSMFTLDNERGYGLTFSPAQSDSAIASQLQTGVTVTATWYQPKFAYVYNGLRRYQYQDYVLGYSIYSTTPDILAGITTCVATTGSATSTPITLNNMATELGVSLTAGIATLLFLS